MINGQELVKTELALQELGVTDRLNKIEQKTGFFKPASGEGGGGTGDLTKVEADLLYVKKAGDTMQGDLIFPVNGFIMTDANNIQWRVTIDTTGHLVTSPLTTGTGGWLGLGFTLFD